MADRLAGEKVGAAVSSKAKPDWPMSLVLLIVRVSGLQVIRPADLSLSHPDNLLPSISELLDDEDWTLPDDPRALRETCHVSSA